MGFKRRVHSVRSIDSSDALAQAAAATCSTFESLSLATGRSTETAGVTPD